MNFVWYLNVPEEQLQEIMIDVDGHRQGSTLPVCKMRDEVWYKQKDYAATLLPSTYLEVMNKIKKPFIAKE